MEILNGKHILDLTQSFISDNVILGKNNSSSIIATSKPYKSKIEWIESNGTQYINTGLVGKPNYTLECEIAFTQLGTGSYQYVAGYAYTGASDRIYFIRNHNSNAKLGYTYGQNNTGTTSLFDAVKNTFYKIKVEMNANYQKMYVNDNLVGSSTYGDLNYDENNPSYIYFFVSQYPNSAGVNGYSYIRAKNIKWSFGGEVVRNYIPVIDWNNKVCLFDEATGKFAYNQGIGDFIAGDII